MTLKNVDEILEALWLSQENKWEPTTAAVLETAHGEVGEKDLAQAVELGLVEEESPCLKLTVKGEAAARELIRRHRLAERLLEDVLQVSGTGMESTACAFEHFLSPEVTDSICTLLGHPPVCPHGNPIPPGPDCGRLSKEIGPVVRRLSDVSPGESVKVCFITSDLEKRLERLGSLGVHPGSYVRLVQRRPSFILEVDQTSLAVEREVAEGIFVRRA